MNYCMVSVISDSLPSLSALIIRLQADTRPDLHNDEDMLALICARRARQTQNISQGRNKKSKTAMASTKALAARPLTRRKSSTCRSSVQSPSGSGKGRAPAPSLTPPTPSHGADPRPASSPSSSPTPPPLVHPLPHLSPPGPQALPPPALPWGVGVGVEVWSPCGAPVCDISAKKPSSSRRRGRWLLLASPSLPRVPARPSDARLPPVSSPVAIASVPPASDLKRFPPAPMLWKDGKLSSAGERLRARDSPVPPALALAPPSEPRP